MDSMELASLYNELSSYVRLTILEMLIERDARFSEIVKRVELSSPEVSRHLKRLQDASLIEKQVEGGYRLSLLGDTVMRMTANMESLMDKSDYFKTHDTSSIPTHLLRELESIEDARVENVFAMMGTLYTNISESEFIWDIIVQSSSSETVMMNAFDVEELDLEIRFLSNRELIDDLIEKTPPLDIKIEFKVRESSGFTVTVMSNSASLALPDKSGVIDRNAYIMGDSPEFIDWCKRLFLHYWDSAERY